jgi:hypothetical protein
MASKGASKKVEADLAEMKATVAGLQETLGGVQTQMATLTDVIKEMMGHFRTTPNAVDASIAESICNYDPEAWTSSTYFTSLVHKKLAALNKNLGDKNSRNNDNSKPKTAVLAEWDLQKEFQGLCIACFKAGKNPEQCVVLRPQDVLHNPSLCLCSQCSHGAPPRVMRTRC